MSISPEQVRRIARLGRLKLSTEEQSAMSEDLGRVLGYIEMLNELDTTDVEPTSHVLDLVNVTREDEHRPSLSVEAALGNAPDRAGNFYRVPKIIE